MWTFSVQYNGAAVATVLAFSSPAMTAILSRLIFKEQFSRVKVVSILLSLAGTILVSGAISPQAWQLNPAGIIFGLLTGLFFAIYNLEGKHASDLAIDFVDGAALQLCGRGRVSVALQPRAEPSTARPRWAT